MTSRRTGFFSDERQTHSMGRALLAITTSFILLLIACETFLAYKVSGEAWTILTTMEGAFTIWTAGPRIAQYLVPVMQTGIQALRDVVSARRVDGTERTP